MLRSVCEAKILALISKVGRHNELTKEKKRYGHLKNKLALRYIDLEKISQYTD